MDEIADRPFGYFFPESNVSILDGISEVDDVFLALFGVAFFHENNIDVLRINCPLILFIPMDQPCIPFCSMTYPFEIMTGHDDYIVYLEDIY